MSIKDDPQFLPGPAAVPGARSRISRRRRNRLLILVIILASLSTFVYYISNKGTSNLPPTNNEKERHLLGENSNNKNTKNNDQIFDSLFNLDAVNKYFNSLSKESEKIDKELERKEFEILNKVSHDYEELINDSEELKRLYLDKSHNGIINLGSTGNMAKPELNVLRIKSPKSELDKIRDDNNENKIVDDKIEKMKDGIFENKVNDKDRSIPLSQLTIPDEESFSKIETDQFIKGDITFQNFFSHILELINQNHLSFPLKRRMNLKDGKPIIDNVLFFEESDARLSESDLYSFFDFPQNFIDDLKVKHENVVNGIPDIVPNFYQGDGYVVVGGGIYSWYALLGIETLRKVGSTKPVEVFLPGIDDYEYTFCEKILPKLNARCVEMYRVFGLKSLEGFDVQGYQYKAFALLASSFENAFLLDSDAYPVTNPDVLFDSKLYKDYKMITWPDFWRRTTSPLFYEIRGTEIGMIPIRHLNDYFVNPKFIDYRRDEDIAVSATYHDRAGTIPDYTTESGEMLINKKEHFKTLLLALYYNFDGPYGYYPLLSQGGAGEGDKETFVASANFYGLKYYQVNKKPERFYGYYNDDQNYEHSTIVQYNPLVDFEMLQNVHTNIRHDMESQGENFKYDYDKYFTDYFTSDVCLPMFYHVHDPKMNPFLIIEKKYTQNEDGVKIRNMGEDFPRINFDLELFVWGVIKHYICEKRVEIRAFDGKDWGLICQDFIEDQLSYLEKSSLKIYDNFRPENVAEQMKGGRDWN